MTLIADMKYTRLVMVFLLLISFSYATTLEPPKSLEETSEFNLANLKESVNQNTDQVPGFVGSLLGDQDINVYIRGENYSRNLSVETSDTRIQSIKKDEKENPGLEIWMDTEDLKDLQNSQEPGQKLQQKLKSDEIRYEEHGLVNSIRFTVFDLLL